MNELKPVAIVIPDHAHGEGVTTIAQIVEQELPAGAELYILPDTHRVVSVEDLNAIIANHDFFMVKFYGTIDFDPSIARDRLRAIIDNKGAT